MRNNRQYQKHHSNYNDYNRNNNYSNNYSNNYYNNNYYENDYNNKNYRNNNYYDNRNNYGYNHSNSNYNNSYKNNNYGGQNKGYNNYNSNNRGNYNKGTTQLKEVEITDKKELKKFDKSEIDDYVKKINESIDPSELKAFCQKDEETIKLSEKECPINNNLMLIDISIGIKGPEEELAYLRHPDYISIIRRGNTLMEKYHYDNRKADFIFEKAFLIRKGMKKFIDLPYNFYREKTEEELKEEEEERKNAQKKEKTEEDEEEEEKPIDKYTLNFDLNEEQVSSLKYIFYPVLQALENDFYIEIIKLMKANGENAQISYIKSLDYWVIASKNVCLLAKNRSDLSDYSPYTTIKSTGEKVPTRYSFAHKIGQCWFDILNNFNDAEIKKIKEYLDGKTFVGEYVGNQYHQHLIRYMKHTILFFGIVINDSCDSSIPIIEAFEKFKEFKLDVVPYEYIGIAESFDELCDKLKKLYVKIAESSIIDEEEGSVVYLSRTYASTFDSDKEYRKEDKILSLFKLKTWEYRVYRKLREKIKNNLLDQNFYSDSRRKISQFFEELRTMLQGFNLPMPFQFYYKVAETAFDFANYYKDKFKNDNNKDGELDLHGSYIDFIETIHSIVDDTVNLKSRIISQNNIMTYDYLIRNALNQRKIVEIIIFAPPCYLSQQFLKEMSLKFQIEILNSFIDESNYANIDKDIIIYHINMHNFRNVNKLGENKYIFAFGLNKEEIEKSEKNLVDNMSNPLFISYNKNKSLLPFIKVGDKEKDRKELFKYFEGESDKYISNLKTNFHEQIKIIDKFQEDKIPEYIKEIGDTINSIKEKIKNLNINEENIQKETFYVNTTNLLDGISDKNEKNTIKHSKYYNSDIIELYEEHINPYEELKENFMSELEMRIRKEKENMDLRTETGNNIKRVIILIPMTIPGNGKTFFIKQLKEIIEKYDINFYSIGSDLIRREIMDNIMRKNKRITEKEAFERSGKPANFKFEEELVNTFEKIYKSDKIKDSIIYIDKNHPPNAINRSTEPIRKYLQGQIKSSFKLDLQFVALIPDCINEFRFGNNLNSFIPFSLSYLIECYLRVKHRDDHPTLNGDTKNLINIFGIFISNFINVSLKENNIILLQKLNRTIKLPFTDEIEEEALPEDLVDAARKFFEELIKNKNNKEPTDLSRKFEELINYYYPKGDEFYPTKNLVKSTSEPIIGNLYNINIKKENLGKIKDFIYLGLEIKGEDNYKKIRGNISSSLKKVKEKYELGKSGEINELIESIENFKNCNLPKDWKYPHRAHKNLWHCTILYKGKTKYNEIKNLDEYKQFIEGEKVNIKLIGIAYVPNSAIVMIIKMDDKIKIQNEYPHITGFIKDFAPKYSNNIMKGIMKNKDINKSYELLMDGKELNEKENLFCDKIEIEGETYNAYVKFLEESVELSSCMHAFEK